MNSTSKNSGLASARLAAASLALACCATALPAAGGGDDDALAKLKAYETARRKLVARLEPSVCAVMSLKRAGGGSGVIFDEQGLILTNYHVTTTNKIVKIGLPDGRFHLADVVGIDPGGDIAVCALRGKGPLPNGKWPAVRMGDSSKLKLGGFVYAMGNPFLLASDFKPTVTVGIVSGIHRYQGGTGPNGRVLSYPDCIQVDAAVNPGNSGGPLFDENGLLVGINGRITIRDRGRVNTGVGFAVSVDQIRNFLPSLLAGRHSEHGTLSINAWRMQDPNTGVGSGVFVQGMLDNCSAYKRGLRTGDKLLAFDGRPIRWVNDLARWQGVLPAGFEVALRYASWDESSRAYAEPRTMRIALDAFDTGSSRNDAPNVPKWGKRPDFKALRKKAAEDAKKPKPKPKPKPVPADVAKWPKGLKRLLPRRDDAPKRFDELDKKLKKRVEAAWKKLEKARLPKPRDLDREEALFRYMDALVAKLKAGLRRSLELAPEAAAKDAKDKEVALRVVRLKRGERSAPIDRVLRVRDSILEIAEGKRVKRSDDKDADVASSLRRRLALHPLVAHARLLGAFEDAYVEDGAHVGERVAYVLALRGPGKRALFVDSEWHVPLGWRFRDPMLGGTSECHIVAWRRDGDRMIPVRAELRVKDKIVEEWEIGAGAPAFFSPLAARSEPDASVEKRVRPLMRSVVKIFGKSGIAKIEAYGSGLVVSDAGHILTWSHANLLDGNARVVFPDGSVHDYRRQIEHPKLGATILRPRLPLSSKQLASVKALVLPAELKQREPGTPVFSISNMFKLAEFAERMSVTFGVVVSSVRSDLRLNLRRFPFRGEVLIVDAPSGPGSHGGGLFGLDGELYGMLTPIVESAETNTQLHMAIPAHELAAFVALAIGKKSEAKRIAAQQSSDAKKAPVEHGILLFEAGRKRSPPAYVDRVRRRSPASKARLRPDDLIVRINEFPIRTCAEFHRAMRNFGPGESIDLTFKRASTVKKVTLRLEAKK